MPPSGTDAPVATQLGSARHASQSLERVQRTCEGARTVGRAASPRPRWPQQCAKAAWAASMTIVGLDVLARAEAVSFLRQRLGRSDPAYPDLAEALGDLPLALEQAAAFITQTTTTPSEYLGLLGERAGELFGLGQPANSEQTIATTWTLALDELRGNAPVAQDLLVLCAFLAPDDIPRTLLEEHHQALPEPLAAAARDQLALRQAFGALHRYALATITPQALS